MIGFGRPEFLLASPAVVLLVWWWHRARRRPAAVPVSSLVIWNRLEPATEARSRRRRSWRLWLEAATALALLLAAAAPYRVLAVSSQPGLTVLVDRRPGMGAVGADQRTRLTRAVEGLRNHLDALPAGTPIRLLALPPVPGGNGTFAAGTAELRSALGAIPVATRSADFGAAVEALDAHGGLRLVVTDEPPPSPADRAGAVAWLSVGAAARNLGIVWARGGPPAPGVLPLSVGILNGGSVPGATRVSLRSGGQAVASVDVSLAPGAVRALPDFPLDPGVLARGYQVAIESKDALAADDVIQVRRGRRGGAVSLVAAEAVPAAVRAALAALGVPPVEAGATDPAPPAPALYWKVAPGPSAEPPWVWVAGEAGGAGLRFGLPFRPTRVEPAAAAVTAGGLRTVPRRVVRALRVEGGGPDAGLGDWRVGLEGIDAAGQRWPLLLTRADGAAVLAFDPVRDAPEWPAEPSFPAFVFAFLGRTSGALEVEGLLSPADTRLGATAVTPAPLGLEPAPEPEARRDALGVWLLLAAVLAMVGICLLEV